METPPSFPHLQSRGDSGRDLSVGRSGETTRRRCAALRVYQVLKAYGGVANQIGEEHLAHREGAASAKSHLLFPLVAVSPAALPA